MSSTTVLS